MKGKIAAEHVTLKGPDSVAPPDAPVSQMNDLSFELSARSSEILWMNQMAATPFQLIQ